MQDRMVTVNEVNQTFPAFGWVILLVIFSLAILDVYLRGKALWRSARNGQSGWFIALLIVNSMGILPAIYLLNNKEGKKK